MVTSTEIGFDCDDGICGYQSLETKVTFDTKSDKSEYKNEDMFIEKDCSDEGTNCSIEIENVDVIDDEVSVDNVEVPSDNKSEKSEVKNEEVFEVVVTFPPTLGRFEDNIEFGSIGPYVKTLCKNPVEINKVKETEPTCGVKNNSPEVIPDDLQDEKNDNVTFQRVEDMDENPGHTNNVEEISNLRAEPKCKIICDDLQDDRNVDKISFQGVEEIDDVKRAGIPVIDDETKEDEMSRFEDEKLNELINYAELQLDEKTWCRDSIRDEIQREMAKLEANNEVLNAANLEIKAAKRLVSSKRQEIDYVQCVINKIKNAVSVEDINSKIYEVGRMLEYEPLWLKDENQFIRENNQLKSMCDRLASNMGSQDEIHLALLQKDKIDDLLKNLKKEMKSIKGKVSKAEVSARAIRKTYDEKNEKGKELQTKFRAADELCQEAYENLSSLKKLLYNKDTPDQPLCVLTNEVKSVPAVSEVETEKSISYVEEKHSDDQDWEKVERKNKHVMKTREPATKVIENKGKEKTYELRKKEIESINMKANGAMKVKKRNAENAQMQAEMQVQKEVEKKEKARLKRLRRKEKKRADSVTSYSNNIDIGDISESNEIKNTIEKPQHSSPNFLPKQLKPKIFPQLATQNQKWLRRHWGKMVNVTAIVILAALSLRNIDFSTLF